MKVDGIDVKRSGYDNLFLAGGYDWHAKMMVVCNNDHEAVDKKAKTLAQNFDKLDKSDPVNVAKWENELLNACGLRGKPLPVVVATAAVVKKAKEEAPAPVKPPVEPPAKS